MNTKFQIYSLITDEVKAVTTSKSEMFDTLFQLEKETLEDCLRGNRSYVDILQYREVVSSSPPLAMSFTNRGDLNDSI